MPLQLLQTIRRLASARQVCALTALAVLAVAAPTANAGRTATKVRSGARAKHASLRPQWNLVPDVELPQEGMIPELDQPLPDDGEKYQLRLARRDGESLDVVYRVGDAYLPDALDSLSEFLRDSHNEEVKSYEPRVFDLLHTLLRKVDHSSSVIEVLCGYRTVETNEALRRSRRTNAAKHSQHIQANALDLRVPGVPAAELRDAALQLGVGGVGYYPKGQFVHVDMGPVRKWTFTRRHASRSKHTHRRRRAS